MYCHPIWTLEFRIFPATSSIIEIKFRTALIRYFLEKWYRRPVQIVKLILSKRFINILKISTQDINAIVTVVKNIFNEYKDYGNIIIPTDKEIIKKINL
jgi:hypothetical protein